MSFQNWYKDFDKFSPEQSKVPKFFILMDFFWAKYILFNLKKYRGVIFHETEDGHKISRRINLSFKNWHKEFDKFRLEHSKVPIFLILMDFFWAKYILFKLKKYKEVLFHETEQRYKIWRGFNLTLQNYHKEFDKFWPKQSKVSIIFTLMCFFWPKYMLFKLKKYRGVIFDETQEGYKTWRGIDLYFQN